jgi:hypothetical protein
MAGGSSRPATVQDRPRRPPDVAFAREAHRTWARSTTARLATTRPDGPQATPVATPAAAAGHEAGVCRLARGDGLALPDAEQVEPVGSGTDDEPARPGFSGAAVEDLVGRATSNTVVMDRFRGTARLSRADAAAIGALGVVARASGITIDARVAHPFIDRGAGLAPVVEEDGDVMARFLLRAREIAVSLRLVAELTGRVQSRDVRTAQPMRRRGSGLGIVEGWRGTIMHRVELSPTGRLARVAVVDPSFLTWPALSVALADTIVPDFPLANNSFNLFYAGNDL